MPHHIRCRRRPLPRPLRRLHRQVPLPQPQAVRVGLQQRRAAQLSGCKPAVALTELNSLGPVLQLWCGALRRANPFIRLLRREDLATMIVIPTGQANL